MADEKSGTANAHDNYPPSEKPNFRYGLIVLTVAIISYLIAFASPYWLQTYSTVPLDFENMGLWQVCLNKYIFRADATVREFNGCYWAFTIEFEDRREVFNPGFFVMVQIFSVAVLIFYGFSSIILLLIFLRCLGINKWYYWLFITVVFGMSVISGLLLFVMVVTVGAMKGDRDWMPRADLIWLSWGYAFAVLSSLMSFVAAYFFGKDMRDYRNAEKPRAKFIPMMGFGMMLDRQGDAGQDPPDFASSRYAPSQM